MCVSERENELDSWSQIIHEKVHYHDIVIGLVVCERFSVSMLHIERIFVQWNRHEKIESNITDFGLPSGNDSVDTCIHHGCNFSIHKLL